MVESPHKQLEVRPKRGKLLIAFCVFVLGLCVACLIYLSDWREESDSAVSATNQTIDESGSPAGAPNHERGGTHPSDSGAIPSAIERQVEQDFEKQLPQLRALNLQLHEKRLQLTREHPLVAQSREYELKVWEEFNKKYEDELRQYLAATAPASGRAKAETMVLLKSWAMLRVLDNNDAVGTSERKCYRPRSSL